MDDRSQGLLFSFFDRSARLRTVDRIADVEPSARGAVMVTDPRSSLARDRVVVADLSKKGDDGRYRTWITRRGRWLARVKPKLSHLQQPLEQLAERRPLHRRSRHRVRRRRLARRHAHARAAASGSESSTASDTPSAKPAKAPRIVLYGTSWCGSCRAARRFFRQKGVSFVDLDVEKDPAAARRLVALQQRYGLRQGVVPLIMVGGRPFQGFSRMQLEVALRQLRDS